jgi:hypothetical protein
MTLIRKIDTENMIAKGAKTMEEESPKWVKIVLGLTPIMVDKIDKQRDTGISRCLWIRLAIQEKLKKDAQNGDLI